MPPPYVVEAAVLSAEVLGWARTAHYVAVTAENGEVQLRSRPAHPRTTSFVAADRAALN